MLGKGHTHTMKRKKIKKKVENKEFLVESNNNNKNKLKNQIKSLPHESI